MEPRRRVAVLLAGGTGTRMGSQISGDLPKQLLEVGGRTLLEHALRTFHRHPAVDAITIVMAAGHLDAARAIVEAGGYADKVTHVVEGGPTRGDSTVAALATLGDDPCLVLVHDAARPLVTPRIISDCFESLASYPVVNVAIETADTIVEVDADGLVRATLDRSSLRRVQTPQGFHSEVLREAHALAGPDPDFAATDDCGVVMRYLPDQPVVVVPGDERNLKVTTPADLQVVAALLAAESLGSPPCPTGSSSSSPAPVVPAPARWSVCCSGTASTSRGRRCLPTTPTRAASASRAGWSTSTVGCCGRRRCRWPTPGRRRGRWRLPSRGTRRCATRCAAGSRSSSAWRTGSS